MNTVLATLNDITLDPMNIHKKQTNISNNMNSSHKNQPVLELVLWHSVKMHSNPTQFLHKILLPFSGTCYWRKILLTLYKEFSFFSNAWCWRRRIKLFFWISWTLQKEFPNFKLLTPQIWIKVKHTFLHVAKKRVWFIIKITTSSW